MKVLVTGANGFLAANVIRELMKRRHIVRGMLREKCNDAAIRGLEIERVRGNIVSYSDVLYATRGCDVIIHVAADTSQLYTDPLPLFPVNVEGTAHVIRAAKEAGVKRLIFVSTANTIGSHDSLSALYRKSGYALSKLKAEELILNETKSGELNAVIVNPTFMLGAYDAKPSSGRMIIMFRKSRIVFYPGGGKNIIDVKAAATAICNAIEHGRSGEKYVLAGENLSFREFLRELQKVDPVKSVYIRIPSFILLILGLAGSFLRIVGLKTELNYYNARILTKLESISGLNAEEELLMPKTKVGDAIKDALNWFRENGYLKQEYKLSE